MLTVEFIKKEGQQKKNNPACYLVVNGVEDHKSIVFKKSNGNIAEIRDNKIIEIIVQNSFKEIGKNFKDLSFYKNINEREQPCRINIFNARIPRSPSHPATTKIIVSIKLEFNREEWNRPYSIKEMSAILEKFINELNDTKYAYESSNIRFVIEDNNLRIKDKIDDLIEILNNLILKAKNALLSNLDNDTLSTFFQFPANIKTACKQYLIYFAQFLRDLGIEAETEIIERSHETLFKVIPKEKGDALDKIREALQIYLNAPGYKNFEVDRGTTNEIAVMQWQANILHFKAQLALSNSIIQAKDATIEALQLSNYEYRTKLLDKQSLKESDKEEEVIKDIISLKKFDGKWFSINIPEIFRKLKRRF